MPQKLKKKVKGKPTPWLTKEVKQNMNKRDQLLRKSWKTKSEVDISAYKRKRNETNILLRKAKAEYHRDLLRENSNNPEKFWNTIKKVYPTKSGGVTSCTFNLDGEKSNNLSKITNAFSEYLLKAPQLIKEQSAKLCKLVWRQPSPIRRSCDNTFKFQHVSVAETEQLLKKIKVKQSTGIDDLPAQLLKDSASVISSPLTSIINTSLNSSTFPTEWKHAKVVPIYKSGSQSSIEYYRPISILPLVSKVIEKSVHTQLLKHLEENNLLTNV